VDREARLSPLFRRRLVHGGLTAVAVGYVGALVLAPLAGIAWAAVKAGAHGWSTTLSDPDARHAYLLTGVITLVTVLITAVLGVVVALVLARDRFPGRALLSAVADVPFAVSPVIVGLMVIV